MNWLGKKPLHTLLLLTERPGRWAPWKIWPAALLLAVGCAWLWAHFAAGSDGAGSPLPPLALPYLVALGLLAFNAADWALLAGLPRHSLSFGPVQPPWLGLVLLRCAIALAAAPLAGGWILPALIACVLCQVLLSALLAYGTLIEPFRLQISRVQVPTAKLSNPGAPLRILQLADLHVERLTCRERALPCLVAGLEPDLILITGDYLSTSYNADSRAVADLRSLLAQFQARGGVYAVLGTPEVDRPEVLRPVLAGLGIVLLEDQAAEVEVLGHRLWLMGVSCDGDLAPDRLRDLLAAAPPEAFSVLLHHTPDLMPHASALGVDLVLAGHTHGGQWRLPGFGAILTSSRYWKRYEAGLYREGSTHMYVSRGIGMEGFGAPRARFFCPPELSLFTVVGTPQHM